MNKELTPEEIKRIKIARLRQLQRKYYEMDKREKLPVTERAHIGAHSMALQMRADRLENGGI